MPVRVAEEIDEGQVRIAGRNVDINKVIRQKHMLIDINGDNINIDFYELVRKGVQLYNPAYVNIDGAWVSGHTEERRLKLDRPERQTIFISGSLKFVVSSEPIFS